MKITKCRYDLKPGTYVYVADYGTIVITSEYDPYHKWYHYHDTEMDENGNVIELDNGSTISAERLIDSEI